MQSHQRAGLRRCSLPPVSISRISPIR